MQTEKILILDFGSQYTQLIARRVRELGVYSELFPANVDPAVIKQFQAKAVILSGGPESVVTKEAPRIPDVLFELGVPILGICYGMQALALQLGGEVAKGTKREFGLATLVAKQEDPLIRALAAGNTTSIPVWMSHGDHVTQVPSGFQVTAKSTDGIIASMADLERRYFGVQFHPEVTHTEKGLQLLEAFLYGQSGCTRRWITQNIIEDMIDNIRLQVGQETVLLGLSGGVDSAVAAALLGRAIGSQLLCVFVDNGLLRLHEAEEVMKVFGNDQGLRVVRIDAKDQFLETLKGVSDPEEKRKVIGKVFIDVFEAEAKKHSEIRFLAQGTIYPDVIESAGSGYGSKTIKSHHNVGGLPERMHLKLIEPLRSLFKDEVRGVGRALGLPETLINRHPFPGPGLGVRILGEVTSHYCHILRQVDAIFLQVLQKHGWYEKVSQAFAVFLPVKSVGVVGDARQYEYVVSLRAVQTVDFMTARVAELPYALLIEASSRILNEVRGVSRVTYDISGKPPATIEWE